MDTAKMVMVWKGICFHVSRFFGYLYIKFQGGVYMI